MTQKSKVIRIAQTWFYSRLKRGSIAGSQAQLTSPCVWFLLFGSAARTRVNARSNQPGTQKETGFLFRKVHLFLLMYRAGAASICNSGRAGSFRCGRGWSRLITAHPLPPAPCSRNTRLANGSFPNIVIRPVPLGAAGNFGAFGDVVSFHLFFWCFASQLAARPSGKFDFSEAFFIIHRVYRDTPLLSFLFGYYRAFAENRL